MSSVFQYPSIILHSTIKRVIKYIPTPFQVLDLPSNVVMAVTPPSERPASAYKAAVDHFIQSDSSSSLTPQEQVETPLPDVQESNTQLLRELMASAKTMTAREDLLHTLRSAREAVLPNYIIYNTYLCYQLES